MVVSVTNAQHEAPVHKTRMAQVATQAVRVLRIRARGTLAITFIDSRRMQALNRRFMGRDRTTDVLSFRYDGEPVIGEILIAPRQARAYATAHGLRYDEELSRYVVHGILHWLGHEDNTVAQQRRMRQREDWFLKQCVC